MSALTDDIPFIPAGDPGKEQAVPKPKSKRQPPKPLTKDELPKKEVTNEQITKVAGEILSFTAVIHATPVLPSLRCSYCRDRILDKAPESAKELVKLSEDYPLLRSALVGVTRFFGGLSAFNCVADLYGASFAHHGPEVPMITPMAQVIYGQSTKKYPDGMPPRQPKKPRVSHTQHAHSEASEGTNAAASNRATETQ